MSVLPPLNQIPADVVAVADYEPLARARMSAAAWAYLQGGAADEHTLAENRAAFDRIRLLPRVLAAMADGHTQTQLFGQCHAAPILLAPVAFQQLAHTDAENATVLAACAMKTGMVVSTQASVALETLAHAAQSPLWFQLYIQPDRDFTYALVARAQTAGYQALVVTVDAPVNGVRNREQRTGFSLPAQIRAVNLHGMQSLPPEPLQAGGVSLLQTQMLRCAATWQDVQHLRQMTHLPILLKGILNPEDALRAVDAGIDGIIVSNHGGRTLDGLPASIDALPAVAQAVAGRIPVLLDGGIRRGTDIFKALALGAAAVLIGRPFMHGLAAAGASGVVHVLHILRTELEIAMVLTGCKTLADIDQTRIWSRPA